MGINCDINNESCDYGAAQKFGDTGSTEEYYLLMQKAVIISTTRKVKRFLSH